jgi:hypothetical protein
MSQPRYHRTIAYIKSSNEMLSLHRPISIFFSTMKLPWLSPTENWLIRSADCLQDKSSARIPQKTLSSFLKGACLQLRCLVVNVLLFCAFAWSRPHRKHNFPYIVLTFLRGWVLTGRCIETAVLLLPVVAVTVFIDICVHAGRGELIKSNNNSSWTQLPW